MVIVFVSPMGNLTETSSSGLLTSDQSREHKYRPFKKKSLLLETRNFKFQTLKDKVVSFYVLRL